VYQPNLIDTFSTDKILLPYFYDQINSLRPVDQRDKLLTISSIPGLAKDVCTGPTLWEERWGSDKVVVEELEDRPVWYLDLTFVYTLLWLGYEFGEDGRAKIWEADRRNGVGLVPRRHPFHDWAESHLQGIIALLRWIGRGRILD
jgi:guanosine-diphosphatase